MDDQRFDNLTRSLAGGMSRRQLLKGLAGAVLGGSGALGGSAAAGAVICRQAGVLCAKDANCCSGSCDPATHRCGGDPPCRDAGHPCEGNQTCCAGLVCQASGPGASLRCTTPCTPTTCDAAGVQCGSRPDGCGGTLACGDCPSATCSTGSCDQGHCILIPIDGCCTTDDQCDDGNACTVDACDPTTNTCQHTPLACPPSDGCHTASCNATQGCVQSSIGDGISCGTNAVCCNGSCCPAGQPCVQGSCCMPGNFDSLCAPGDLCGMVPDGCGGMFDCGDPCGECTPCDSTTHLCTTAPNGTSCGGAGSGQVCSDGNCCTPKCEGRNCGGDGCGGSCGTCTGTDTCGGGGTPGLCGTTPTCDCSNLNFCGDHGTCTTTCICACDPGYTGVDCSQLSPVDCTTYTTCTECQAHAGNGCTFCASTFAGATNLCTTADNCRAPQVDCGAGSGSSDPCTGVSCGPCQACGSTGACAADASRNGTACTTSGDEAGTCQNGGCVACTPTTCAAQEVTCGTIPDGCGDTLQCGTCADGQHCAASGQCVCDSTSCDGCCNGNTCEPGDTATACGSGGATCTACTGSDTCSGGPNACTGGEIPRACGPPNTVCDCSNLNCCSGHGTCTETCTCLCDPPYTGIDCSEVPVTTTCADHATCADCKAHRNDGCVFCSTLDGTPPSCTTVDNCASEIPTCDGDASCVGVACPVCQTCSGGACEADATQDNAACTTSGGTAGTCQNGLCVATEVVCAEYTTCADCMAHRGDGCVFCSATLDGDLPGCTTVDNCASEDPTCGTGGASS